MSSTQYQTRYAESDTASLRTLPSTFCWHHALVTPVYDETPDFLASHTASERLLIVVMNRPASDARSDTSWAALLCESLGPAQWQEDYLSLHQAQGSGLAGDVLLVDRCLLGPPINSKHGVGLARKIGCDIACELLQRKQLLTSWIGTSDADAQLPQRYTDTLATLSSQASAAIFPFCHRADGLTREIVTTYELHMLYYVAGLRYAGSPYAWPTIGSCMAINLAAYQQARGFPKRAGGEDFYLLNKLAKLTGVIHLTGPELQIAGRCSQRVPFGTGPALQKIAALDSPEQFTSYHPRSFAVLKAAHEALRLAANGSNFTMESLADGHAVDRALLRTLWQDFGCDTAMIKTRRNHNDPRQRQRALLTWFDAFNCLKWIPACRQAYAAIPLHHALDGANWLTSYGYSPLSKDPASSLQQSLADGKTRGPAYANQQTPGN